MKDDKRVWCSVIFPFAPEDRYITKHQKGAHEDDKSV